MSIHADLIDVTSPCRDLAADRRRAWNSRLKKVYTVHRAALVLNDPPIWDSFSRIVRAEQSREASERNMASECPRACTYSGTHANRPLCPCWGDAAVALCATAGLDRRGSSFHAHLSGVDLSGVTPSTGRVHGCSRLFYSRVSMSSSQADVPPSSYRMSARRLRPWLVLCALIQSAPACLYYVELQQLRIQ